MRILRPRGSVLIITAFLSTVACQERSGERPPASVVASNLAPQGCSLSCLSILGPPEGTEPLPDPDAVKAASAILGKAKTIDDYAVLALKFNDWMVTTAVSSVPLIKEVATTAFNALEGKVSSTVQDAAVKRLNTELARLLDTGEPSTTIKGNASSIVDSLLGPNSEFVTALGLHPTEYQALQTAAIHSLAIAVDNLERMSSDQRAAEALSDDQLRQMTGNLAQLRQSVSIMSDQITDIDASSADDTQVSQDIKNASTPETKSVIVQTSALAKTERVAALGDIFSKQMQAQQFFVL